MVHAAAGLPAKWSIPGARVTWPGLSGGNPRCLVALHPRCRILSDADPIIRHPFNILLPSKTDNPPEVGRTRARPPRSYPLWERKERFSSWVLVQGRAVGGTTPTRLAASGESRRETTSSPGNQSRG